MAARCGTPAPRLQTETRRAQIYIAFSFQANPCTIKVLFRPVSEACTGLGRGLPWAARAIGGRRKHEWPLPSGLGWTVNAAACVGDRMRLRWHMQRSALAIACGCVGACSVVRLPARPLDLPVQACHIGAGKEMAGLRWGSPAITRVCACCRVTTRPRGCLGCHRPPWGTIPCSPCRVPSCQSPAHS